MRRLLIAVLLIFPAGTAAQDSSLLKADGRMWDMWGASVKAAYVQGAIEGLRAGAARGYVGGWLDKKQQTDSGTNDEKGVVVGMSKIVSDVTPQHTSVFDIVHQMDKFYSNYKNTPVCMIVAVQESLQSLNGTASSEQGLELSRKGCDPK